MVTGGSEGIGKEFALQFVKAGFNVAITGRSQERLDKLKNEIL